MAVAAGMVVARGTVVGMAVAGTVVIAARVSLAPFWVWEPRLSWVV
jgi:hypothetical protein